MPELTAEQKAAQDKAAAEKAAADKAAADAAAKANAPNIAAQTAAQKKVADAQKALADAEAELAKTGATKATTADEDKKAAAVKSEAKPVVVSGRIGGAFSIDGEGFGNAGGTLMIGGRVIPTTRWNDRSIKGQLPADLGSGEIVLTTAAGVQKGVWPTPPPKEVPVLVVR